MKKMLFCVLVCLLCLPLFVSCSTNSLPKEEEIPCVTPSKGLVYQPDESDLGYIVTDKGECTDTHVVIPETYLGKPVIAIGQGAFAGCYEIDAVTIPASITRIENYAFSKCTGIKSIFLGKNITFISESALFGCFGLQEFVVEQGNPRYSSVDHCLIDTESKTLVAICKNGTIPTDGSVITIGNMVFYDRLDLTEITLPESIVSIGELAFNNCKNLTRINLGGKLQRVGEAAFQGCLKLTSIYLPESVTFVGSLAFNGCSALTFIDIPYGTTELGDLTFGSCLNMTYMVIPSSVTLISGSAGNRCQRLETVYFHGTAQQWQQISIWGTDNEIEDATRYYYSESKPVAEGNYWHYVNGMPQAW